MIAMIDGKEFLTRVIQSMLSNASLTHCSHLENVMWLKQQLQNYYKTSDEIFEYDHTPFERLYEQYEQILAKEQVYEQLLSQWESDLREKLTTDIKQKPTTTSWLGSFFSTAEETLQTVETFSTLSNVKALEMASLYRRVYKMDKALMLLDSIDENLTRLDDAIADIERALLDLKEGSNTI